MEQCDPALAANLPEGSAVTTAPEGLFQDTMSKMEEDLDIVSGEVAERANMDDGTTQEFGNVTSVESRTLTQTDKETEPSDPAKSGEDRLDVDISCDSGTASMEDARTLSAFTDGAGGVLESSPTVLDEVVENSPSVLEGTIETSSSALDGVQESPFATQHDVVESSSPILEGSPETPPAIFEASGEHPPSNLECSTKPPPTTTNSTPDSGVSNGLTSPSTPSSPDTTSSVASSPPANNSKPCLSSSSPYDTDCSRKLMSKIQRSLSQESLLDELESELLACQLPERGGGVAGRQGSPIVNGLQTDQEENMVFEKCVQYKYAQQEKAIKRLLDDNKKHQELILGICSEKDTMREELKRRAETEKQHVATVKKFEARVEELLKELKESRDKLVHQDHAARGALQQMQREVAFRLEQVGQVYTYSLHRMTKVYECIKWTYKTGCLDGHRVECF